MKFTKEFGDQVIAALTAKGAPKACSLCLTNSWTLADGIYFLVSQDDFPNVNLTGKGMPCCALLCNHCGNSHLINLVQLGFGDVLK
jgi:hypothetical protein